MQITIITISGKKYDFDNVKTTRFDQMVFEVILANDSKRVFNFNNIEIIYID